MEKPTKDLTSEQVLYKGWAKIQSLSSRRHRLVPSFLTILKPLFYKVRKAWIFLLT